jgi:hypothetical protein
VGSRPRIGTDVAGQAIEPDRPGRQRADVVELVVVALVIEHVAGADLGLDAVPAPADAGPLPALGRRRIRIPNSSTPKRVRSEPAANSVPDATAPRRDRPVTTVSPAPAAVHDLGALSSSLPSRCGRAR